MESAKRCTKCRQVKPLSAFYFHNGRYRPDCKNCVRKRSKAAYEADPQTKLAANRRWSDEHPEKGREYVTAFRTRDPDHASALARGVQQRLRAKVFDHYGWRCACCGSTENLSIDHVFGGGNQHRSEMFGDPGNSQALFRWLVRNDFPAGFQTLCWPCNRSKGAGERCRIEHQEALTCRI